PDIYDEPFADSSQIPTHVISKLTRKHVTVALSGDGGDELFGGYNRYRLAEGPLQRLMKLPLLARRAAAVILELVPDRAAEILASVAPNTLRSAQPADKLRKLVEVLCLDAHAIYLRLVRPCPNPSPFPHRP